MGHHFLLFYFVKHSNSMWALACQFMAQGAEVLLLVGDSGDYTTDVWALDIIHS